MTIDEARAKAHQQYDDCMFLPGMLEAPDWAPHERVCATLNWIEKKAQQILKNSKKNARRS